MNETQIRARLDELWHAQHMPFIDKTTNKQDGYCLRSGLTDDDRTLLHTEQRELNDRLKALLMADPNCVRSRTGYAVAGWSEKHDYFRNKYDTFDSLEEAQACLDKLKSDAEWAIPTVIVQMIWYLDKSTEPARFASAPCRELSGADSQDLVAKHMMGVRGVSWQSLLSRVRYDYTY